MLSTIKILKSKLASWVFYEKNKDDIKNSKILLLDTPIHTNLGDQAITIAEEQYIEEVLPDVKKFEIPANRLEGMERFYSKKVRPDATIIVHGGGFIGYLYPKEEYRIRRIIENFASNKVVIFPQTVTFDMESEEGLKFFQKSKEIYSGHKDLHLFLREEKSYNFVKESMGAVHSYLVPDIVTLIKLDVEKAKPSDRILMCLRSDREKAISEDSVTVIREVLSKRYEGYEISFIDTVLKESECVWIRPEERTGYVNRKLNEFAGAKLIITDRLHGMIFSLLAGTECIAFNNSNGKVGNVYKWISDIDYIHMVSSVEEFRQVVENKININQKYKYDRGLLRDKFQQLEDVLASGMD